MPHFGHFDQISPRYIQKNHKRFPAKSMAILVIQLVLFKGKIFHFHEKLTRQKARHRSTEKKSGKEAKKRIKERKESCEKIRIELGSQRKFNFEFSLNNH